MSRELKDLRGKITLETHCVLRARAKQSGRTEQDIVRDILHEWALRQIHDASMPFNALKFEGISGEVEGIAGSVQK
jgi:predicted DNA-binding protein